MNDADADDEYDYMQTGQAYGGQRSITGAAQDRMCSTQVHVDTILCH